MGRAASGVPGSTASSERTGEPSCVRGSLRLPQGRDGPFSGSCGGGAAAAEDVSSIPGPDSQATQEDAGRMAFCWSGKRPHGILRELFWGGGNGEAGCHRIALALAPAAPERRASSSSSPVDLAASGEGRGGGAPRPRHYRRGPFVSPPFFAGRSLARGLGAAGGGRRGASRSPAAVCR